VKNKPKILITNDDGIHAKGLIALHEALCGHFTVSVVAPDRERSAVGHGITLHEPVRADRLNFNGTWGYALSGTPVDCIKLSLLELLEDRPDMIISGINPGENTGVNINYSGTVAAAREAALYGLPSISVSVCSHEPKHYNEAAMFTKNLAEKVLKKGLPFGTFLNVNIPDISMSEVNGIVLSKHGTEFSKEYIEKKTDPRNKPYYWQGAEQPHQIVDPGIDSSALMGNYISITPIKCDMTDYQMIEELKIWNLHTKDD
jgi:5'-nucleotidase